MEEMPLEIWWPSATPIPVLIILLIIPPPAAGAPETAGTPAAWPGAAGGPAGLPGYAEVVADLVWVGAGLEAGTVGRRETGAPARAGREPPPDRPERAIV